MPSIRLDSPADLIVAAWLDGAESAYGQDNPAGPLYVGGAATEAALVDAAEALLTRCSSCSGSLGSYCC
ncbi:DUF6229 family protein [Streptomyces sp. NBC_01803]|uniref:DUF6229 family protein n=1 Tax=Streptomyces sp. NBC_01803 TaxID=2975946 RepID=UPI002DD990D4|nr:DUF6229 family protein [Streptomyces sp. NBC_01803]WSA44251.1 DUF6229 family protein [Streptomyces sp. NBC_01803]